MIVAEFVRKYGLELFSVLGALIGVSFVERLTIVAAAVAFVAGLAFAMVTAPIATYYIDPDTAIRDYILAALAGLFSLVGFVVCSAIYATARHAKEWLPGLVRRWVERRWGGGP